FTRCLATFFCFPYSVSHRDLPSFPTRRSSDLVQRSRLRLLALRWSSLRPWLPLPCSLLRSEAWRPWLWLLSWRFWSCMPVFFWLFGIFVSPAARDWARPKLATGALASGAFFVSKRLTLPRSGAVRSRCRRYDPPMATGWAGDTAVQDQIDATVEDAIKRARSRLPQGPGLSHCEECDAPIPEARRKAMPGVRLCVPCQEALDREDASASGYNRRGSKDSQLR